MLGIPCCSLAHLLFLYHLPYVQGANHACGASYVFTISWIDLLTTVNKRKPIISRLIVL